MKKRIKRDKAWAGALIGTGISLLGSIGGSLIGANASKKAADKQAALQQELWAKNQTSQNKKDALEQARNLTSVYSNQEYVDEYRDKLSFRNGGNYHDRMKFVKRFKCGGRRKAEGGTQFDWSSIIDGVSTAASALGSSAINANTTIENANKQKNYFVESSDIDIDDNIVGKGKLKKPSYIDRLYYYKLGGKCIKK